MHLGSFLSPFPPAPAQDLLQKELHEEDALVIRDSAQGLGVTVRFCHLL